MDMGQRGSPYFRHAIVTAEGKAQKRWNKYTVAFKVLFKYPHHIFSHFNVQNKEILKGHCNERGWRIRSK